MFLPPFRTILPGGNYNLGYFYPPGGVKISGAKNILLQFMLTKQNTLPQKL